MLPINSGSNLPCTPVSSNCVVWQGPDITCINLCNGDTVSEVIAKIATKLCELVNATASANPDLSTLTLNCIPAPTAATPTFLDYMQNIVNYICSLPTDTASLPNATIPRCLPYPPDPITGESVTSLPLKEFAEYLATQICILLDTIPLIQNTLNDHAARLLILENCILPCKTTGSFAPDSVVSTVYFPGSSVNLTTLLLTIESTLGDFTTSVGSLSSIGTSLSAQGISGAVERLSASGTYSSDSLWINSPSSLSQSHQDQWIVLNDLYTAVSDLQSLVDVGCDAATFGFTYNVISDGAGLATDVNLNFTSSTIPSSFSDCNGGTIVKITDSNGNSVTQSVNVSNLQSNSTGVTISLLGLNVLNSVTVEIPFCVTDGSSQCREVKTQIIPLNIPCPSDITVTGITQTAAVVTFSNFIGRNVEYKIDVVNVTTQAVEGSVSITSPGTAISKAFTGLSEGVNYNVNVTIISNGVPKICPSVTFTTLGVVCNDVSITATGAAGSNDIFLGYKKTGGSNQLPYHYNPDSQQIVVGTSGAVACHAPTVVFNSMNTATGEINLTLSYGAVSGLSITLESSSDGLTYTNSNVGSDGVRVYATGVTTNTVYIRAFVSCSGSVNSEYLLFRFDFGTETFMIMNSPEQCLNDETITSSCPMGIQVARQVLSCGATNYSVFSGGSDSYWFYVDKYNRNGATVYLYAGWTQAGSPTTVVECCACPAFILSDSHQLRVLCQEGNSVSINIPYVIGEGTPTFTTVSSTNNGTLVQSATNSNLYTYTHVNTGNSYADTFQVKLQPQTVGDCESMTVTIQIQIVPCSIKLVKKNQPIFAYVDTGSFTSAEGANLKAALVAFRDTLVTDHSYTGLLYFIPVIDKKWLGYQKSVVDNGTSANLDPAAAWVALRVLPSTWSGGSGVPIYKEAALILAFTNDASGNYHDSTLAAGFGSGGTLQPRTDYLNDYDALHDSLNGTVTSSWGASLPIRNAQFPDGLSIVHYPYTVQDSVSADAAQVLQSLAAYTGEMIPATEYGIKTAVDVSGYLLQGLIPSATNPYQGASTSGGNTLQPLYKKSCFVLVNNVIKTNTFAELAAGTDDQFNAQMDEVVNSCTNTFPTVDAGTVHYSALSCATGSALVINRTGGPYYAINSTYESLAADNSTPDDLYFTVTGYTTASATVDVNNSSLSAGCEASGSVFLLQDCTTGSQFVVDMGSITGIDVGEVYKLTNNGSGIPESPPREAWEGGETKCLFVVSTSAASAETTVTFDAVYASCVSCTIP